MLRNAPTHPGTSVSSQGPQCFTHTAPFSVTKKRYTQRSFHFCCHHNFQNAHRFLQILPRCFPSCFFYTPPPACGSWFGKFTRENPLHSLHFPPFYMPLFCKHAVSLKQKKSRTCSHSAGALNVLIDELEAEDAALHRYTPPIAKALYCAPPPAVPLPPHWVVGWKKSAQHCHTT